MVRAEGGAAPVPAAAMASPITSATWAALRPGASRLHASARASTSAGVRGSTRRGLGTRASKPPARHALIHSSRVERPTRTTRPSGPTWSAEARARTSAPRSAFVSFGSAGSLTRLYRKRPTSRWRSCTGASSLGGWETATLASQGAGG